MNRRQRRNDRHVAAVALTFLSLPFLILAIMIVLKGVLS